MMAKVHFCYTCLQPFNFSHDFYESLERGYNLSCLSMKLNLDGSPHDCQRFNIYYDLIKRDGYKYAVFKYFILPGSPLHDFYRLWLELGPTIEGFIAQHGNMLGVNPSKERPFRYRGKVSYLTEITLPQFIHIYFPEEKFTQFHKVFDIRTRKIVPWVSVIVLLLMNRGITIINEEKRLIWADLIENGK